MQRRRWKLPWLPPWRLRLLRLRLCARPSLWPSLRPLPFRQPPLPPCAQRPPSPPPRPWLPLRLCARPLLCASRLLFDPCPFGSLRRRLCALRSASASALRPFRQPPPPPCARRPPSPPRQLGSVAALRSTSALAFSSTLALSAASAAALRSAAAFAVAAALASGCGSWQLDLCSGLLFDPCPFGSLRHRLALGGRLRRRGGLGFRCGSALDLCSGLLFDPCPFGSLRRRLALGGRLRRRGSLGFRCFGGCGVPRLAGGDRRLDRCGGLGAAQRRIVGSRRMAPGKLSGKPRQRLLEVGFVAVVRRLAAERLRRAAGLEEQDGLQGGRTKPASSRPAETVINRGRRHLCLASPAVAPRGREGSIAEWLILQSLRSLWVVQVSAALTEGLSVREVGSQQTSSPISRRGRCRLSEPQQTLNRMLLRASTPQERVTIL